MTRFIALLLFALNCQSPSNPSLADEFVHGEINSRKKVIEKAFALWGIRGQVDVVSKNEDNQNRIVFTDTCTEDALKRVRISCIRTIVDETLVGGCIYKPQGGSTIFIRRTYFQNTDDQMKLALLAHEIGHCIGLSHTTNEFDLMFPVLLTVKPNEAEIAKVKTLWPEGQLFKFSLSEGY